MLIQETTIVELICFGPVSTWLSAGQLGEESVWLNSAFGMLVHGVNIK